MSPIYNHTGDDGTTGLLGEGRLPKYHPRMETLGVLDEASAALGLARALCKAAQTGTLLKDVQRDLYIIMAEVAATPENVQRFPDSGQANALQWLESQAEAIAAWHPSRRNSSCPEIPFPAQPWPWHGRSSGVPKGGQPSCSIPVRSKTRFCCNT